MITRQELEGKWKQLKGQIREQWGQLTDDELQRFKGDGEQLVGMIQEKTGQSRREIETYLDNLVHEGQSRFQQVSDTARHFAETANQRFQEGYQEVGKQLESGYSDAKDMVQSRPLESVVAAFGIGLISGAIVALMMRSTRA
ncbi:MAG TPA: CsbD family protein [Planctomicrobium sp.]|nr:CsbD family protein [Planctomicrobium sp.]